MPTYAEWLQQHHSRAARVEVLADVGFSAKEITRIVEYRLAVDHGLYSEWQADYSPASAEPCKISPAVPAHDLAEWGTTMADSDVAGWLKAVRGTAERLVFKDSTVFFRIARLNVPPDSIGRDIAAVLVVEDPRSGQHLSLVTGERASSVFGALKNLAREIARRAEMLRDVWAEWNEVICK